jgi:membrane protein DedA with SNARE-associated domain
VHITQARLDRVHAWFHRIGDWLLMVGYFIPGVRHFTALVAGMSKLEYRTFAGFAYAGAAIWVATFLSIGYFVGENWRAALALVHRYTLAFAATLVLAAALVWWLRRLRR